MRKIKEYFHMILTAFVCLAVSLFSKKSMKDPAGEKQAVSSSVKTYQASGCGENKNYRAEKSRERGFARFSPGDHLKKVFFWLQGPGDIPLPD